jgi:hypothetical protein
VKEVSTCVYKLRLYTPILCELKEFEPESDDSTPILCSEIPHKSTGTEHPGTGRKKFKPHFKYTFALKPVTTKKKNLVPTKPKTQVVSLADLLKQGGISDTIAQFFENGMKQPLKHSKENTKNNNKKDPEVKVVMIDAEVENDFINSILKVSEDEEED